ncbi:hypothetical protein LZL87_007629 [Fusarium oxysporum]|nr:hypothetical protein LZL87_007629 [Fusarium oxysporum]
MVMSKPASEQELAEKRRRELKASTILTEFAKRHRRKLEGPLDTTEAVAQATGISLPNGCAISATDSSGKFCSFFEINAINKATIEAYLRAKPRPTTFVPTFIPCNPARKNLSPDSIHPTLDIESTLPHCRLEHLSDVPRPAQNEYPVCLGGRRSLVSLALQVETQEQEDALRAYKTDAYEVVRCTIHIVVGYTVEAVPGLTFRLIEEAMD